MTFGDDSPRRPVSPDDVVKRILSQAPDDLSLTEEEWMALKGVASVWLGLQFIGRAAGFLRSILSYVGWAVALFLMWKAGLIDWIKGVE